MIMRLYTEEALAQHQPISLTPPQIHYLRNVMRAGPGDTVILFNGRDGEWAAQIDALSKGSGTLMPQEKRRDQLPELGPWLLFAPIKRAPLDFLVQKAVELGVAGLQPVFTSHTNSERINLDRLTANAIEAAEQCERLTVPEIRTPGKLTAIFENWPTGRHLMVCAEHGAAQGIDHTLRSAAENEEWAILIGPEGGFAPSELDQLRAMPFASLVSLGPRILRAETAALAALTCWQAVLGDWNNSRS